MKRRFLAALMLIVFTIVSFGVVPVSATAFTDLEDDSSTLEAVTVLSKLGVINGYKEDDGSYTFRPDNNVTRAEFTAMLLRTRGMGNHGNMSLDNPPFPDVTEPSVSWAIGNIRTAQSLGIINGYKEDDGSYTFRPNNTVLYEEAVKMIVCALGYGEMGTEGAEWYSRYLMSAIQLKFVDGAGGSVGTPATRATIAKMLYNCLEVNIAENNEVTTKTILESDLKLTKKKGYIASNPSISLSEPESNLRDNEIQITAPNAEGRTETLTYKVDNVDDYADMLGAQITFYYSEDRGSDTRTLVMATVEKSVTVEVEADALEPAECDDSTIAYYAKEDASRSTKLKVSEDSIVVYNGQLYGENAEASTFEVYCDEMGDDALPAIGSIKLLDRNGDKSYDILFVDSYDAYIVSSVTPSTCTIIDNVLRKGLASSENKLVINPDDLSKTVKIVDKNGKDVAFTTIKTGSVICVKESNPLNGGQQVVTAVVCNDTIVGAVKAINPDGSIKIGSVAYKYSALAPWVNPIEGAELVMSKPEMGEGGKFYLDMNGNIIGYDKTEETTNQQYGYIMQAKYTKKGFNETLVFNMITQSGKTPYYGYEKTKINGETFLSYEDLLEELEKTALPSDPDDDEDVYPEETDYDTTAHSQLVKFTTKSYDGKLVVDEIITVTDETRLDKGANVSADNLNFYEALTAADSVEYSSSGKQLSGTVETVDGTKKVNINIGSAFIIKIPDDRSDIDGYKKMNTGDLSNGEDYVVEFYDVATTNSAKVVLVYGGASTAGEVKPDSPVLLITGIEEDTAPDGEFRYKLVGYVGSSKVEDYWVSKDCEDIVADLQPGDVVRLGTDDDDYYTVKNDEEANHIIFSVADEYRDTAIAADPDEGEYPKELHNSSGNLAYRVIWGSAGGRDADLLNVATDVLEDGDEVVDYYQMQRSWFKNAKFFEFDLSEGELEINEDYTTADNESLIDGLTLPGEGRPTELFIHMTGINTVKTVIMIVR